MEALACGNINLVFTFQSQGAELYPIHSMCLLPTIMVLLCSFAVFQGPSQEHGHYCFLKREKHASCFPIYCYQ